MKIRDVGSSSQPHSIVFPAPTGQRVAFVPDGTDGWTLELPADGVEVATGRDGAATLVPGPAG